ncbi:hypothetical protein PHYPSEUDO_013322 [Phytophthora pseudosyringae]|uniref:GAF domain-containing protein n=1 Tax=Phytophthora pseudosyringae TaxID=221518 RepID=A0A8T1W6V0_9STRA|nr:hypothetical protein PHYPSEUDO_013322 [Phytophthora pseudosyringae]
MLEDANKHRLRGWSGSQYSESSSRSTFDPAPSFSTQQSDEFDTEADLARAFKPPSDTEMLERARASHMNVDFDALSAGPGKGGPWKRVEAADQFVVFKHPSSTERDGSRIPGLEVMCAGRLDASLEEVASVLRSNSAVDLASSMQGLHAKNFIFGSLDRDVPCSDNQQGDQEDDANVDTSEQLNVKTSSFMRSNMFSRNEQWCFSDYFQRKTERDGFTISQRALPPQEPTPGRVVGNNARVDQLHGLNATYLVDQLPNRKGLRVVYNAWFEDVLKDVESSATCSDRSMSSRSGSRRRSSGMSVVSTSSTSSMSGDDTPDAKAQLRRLLALAHALTKLPELIRRRRFGIQVPTDFDTVHVANTRCPCCTHSLAPVKMSLSVAASAIAKRSLRPLKMDTRRCYLCGYLVCIDCWSAEYMESTVGRVAAIVVCTRCHACVKACDYSEVCASDTNGDYHRGPVKVVDDKAEDSAAPLLTDFLSASLMNASASGADRAAVLSVVRMLLRQSASTDTESDESYDDDSGTDVEDGHERQDGTATVAQLGKFFSDADQLPALEACVLASAERREYLIDLPDDPATMVPSSVIPSHDDVRLRVVRDKGLLQLAYQLAPLDAAPDSFAHACDVRDLDLLCQLAVRATGCSDSFVTVMGVKHNHILAATNPGFLHAAVPREQTICQHTIMTTRPFVATHPEADVRFHEIVSVKALSIRYYVGFPVNVPVLDATGDFEMNIPVGTLCCIDSTARSELTRSQYATMKRLTDTASRLIQLKGRQLQQQLGPDATLPGDQRQCAVQDVPVSVQS